MKAFGDSGALVGRILLSLIFVMGGTSKLFGLGGTAGYMAAKMGVSMEMSFPLALAAALVELIGGLLIVLGLLSRISALILFLFLIPVTIIFHWLPGETIQVMKNLSIMGGLLMVAGQGPGALSLGPGRRS